MDMVSAQNIADALGVSTPTAHRVLDRVGVPASGRGVTRAAPRELLSRLLEERGAVSRDAGFPASLLRVLAALTRAPWGLPSARRVAEHAGVSPTVASRTLTEAAERGLVQHVSVAAVDTAQGWHATTEAWPSGLAAAVRAVRLPRRRADSRPGRHVPARFRKWFWNVAAGRLELSADGSYIAGRLLASPDVPAWEWTLRNISPADVRTAVSRRGIPVEVAALVENWQAADDRRR